MDFLIRVYQWILFSGCVKGLMYLARVRKGFMTLHRLFSGCVKGLMYLARVCKGKQGFYDFTQAFSNAFFKDILFKEVLHIDYPVSYSSYEKFRYLLQKCSLYHVVQTLTFSTKS